MNLNEVLPDGLRRLLRDRYLAGVADAESLFDSSEASEDALTGALGTSISTRAPLVYADPSGTYSVEITYKKIRGNGPQAPEKFLGADGIFQIKALRASDGQTFSKGLPFQAKKNGEGGKKVVSQARDMIAAAGQGLVVDYSRTGYTACVAEAVIAAKGSSRTLKKEGKYRNLGQILAYDFLDCKLGVEGLIYSPDDKLFVRQEVLHVVDASIVRLHER